MRERGPHRLGRLKMNKKELVAAIADQCDTTQAAAGDFVNAFCEVVTNELKKGDKSNVALPGFGQFIANFAGGFFHGLTIGVRGRTH